MPNVGIPDGSITRKHLCNGAVTRRALEDGSVGAIQISATLESENYDGTTVAAGDATQGWRIEFNTDSAEFQDVTVRGTIFATAGSISGTLITTGLNADVITAGELVLTGTMTIKNAGGETTIDATGIRAEKIYGTQITGVTLETDGPGNSRVSVGGDGLPRGITFFGGAQRAGTISTAGAVTGPGIAIIAEGILSLSSLDDRVVVTQPTLGFDIDAFGKTVTQGATNTGGSGFRALVVPN